MKYVCDNCSSEWTKNDLDSIDDLEARVLPGEPMPAGQCPECGAVCHGVKTKFNHAYQMAFEVVSDSKNPNDNTVFEILSGLSQRLTNLLNNSQELLEACEPYDVYECEAQCKFCEQFISKKSMEKVHLHQQEYVCDNCWSDRLEATK